VLARAPLDKESSVKTATKTSSKPANASEQFSTEPLHSEHELTPPKFSWSIGKVALSAPGKYGTNPGADGGPAADAGRFTRLPWPIQAKLEVGAADDPLEREADRVAEQVMGMPEPIASVSSKTKSTSPALREGNSRASDVAVRRKCSCGGGCDKCNAPQPDEEHDTVQRKPAVSPISTVSSSSASPGLKAQPIVHEVLRSPGQPLDAGTRAFFEPRFGRNLGHVRIHDNAQAVESARMVNALAYTVGSDIVLGNDARPKRHILAHELTHTIQQTRSQENHGATGMVQPEISHFSPRPLISRMCGPQPCPPIEFPFGAFGVFWQEAERCLQGQYIDQHPGHTVGLNGSWVGLKGKNPHEQQTIDFFRSHFTAKGYKPSKKPQDAFPPESLEREGSQQRQAEPDIMDFSNQTIMEITTPAGVAYRQQKVVWEAALATELMNEGHIGSPVLWQVGWWRPPVPCYSIPGGAGKLLYRVWSQGGVLTYLPVADVTQEAFAAALAAAAAAAAKRLSKLKPPGPPAVPVPIHDPAIQSDSLFDALLVTALIALAIFLLPEEIVGAAIALAVRAIVAIGTALYALLSGEGLAFGSGGGGGSTGSGSSSGTGGETGGGKANGGQGGSGSAGGAGKAASGGGSRPGGSQAGAGGTQTTTGKAASVDPIVQQLMQIIGHMVDPNGDPISREDAEHILALGVELLKSLQAADPKDPNAKMLKDLAKDMLPLVQGELKKLQQGKGGKGGGKPAAPSAPHGGQSGATGHEKTGAGDDADKPETVPKSARQKQGQGKASEGQGQAGKGAATPSSGKGGQPGQLVPVTQAEASSGGLKEFSFRVPGFDPSVSRAKGDPVNLSIVGEIDGQPYSAQVIATFDHQEQSKGVITNYLELPSDLRIEGTDRVLHKEIRIVSTAKKK
jgi:hypothetical protein